MSQYLEALRQAMVIYPMIVVLFTVPYIAWSYHKYGSVLSLRVLIVYSFLLYLLCVYCLVILPLPTPEKAATLHGHKAQLIPFSFLADIVKQAEIQPGQPASWLHIFTGSAFWTTIFNLFMTMPFGVYLRYYFCYHWRKTLQLSFLLSLFFELTQLSGLYFAAHPARVGYRQFPTGCFHILYATRFCLSGRHGLPDLCIVHPGRVRSPVWNYPFHSMAASSISSVLWAASCFLSRADSR